MTAGHVIIGLLVAILAVLLNIDANVAEMNTRQKEKP